MPVFLVANPKGGVGKSTVATNLAGYFARQGHRTMLGDLDRQQSSRAWLALRPSTLPAIETWDVDALRLTTVQGAVRDPSGRELAYGKLARRAASIVLAHKVSPKKPSQYGLIGTSPLHRLNTAADKANGTAKFGIDVKDGKMLYAAIRSVPTLSGVIASYDGASATSRSYTGPTPRAGWSRSRWCVPACPTGWSAASSSTTAGR